MSHRILILQRDAQGPAVWRYRLADDDGELPAGAHRLRHDPAPGFEPVAESAESAEDVLADRDPPGPSGRRPEPHRVTTSRITSVEKAPEPPPRGPERRWERSTAGGKSKGRGETLSKQVERNQEGRPRAAA